MASPDVASQSPDRHSRRRPFAQWVKRLANLKSDNSNGKKTKKSDHNRMKNHPYPESGQMQVPPAAAEASSVNGTSVYTSPASRSNTRSGSISSMPNSEAEHGAVAQSNKSAAPTVETNPETIHSDAGRSNAFTAKTGGAFSSVDGAGRNSTFSSPSHSEQSLTTTLTTIQSTSPGLILGQHSQGQAGQGSTMSNAGQTISFSPSGPVSALPAHLAPTGNPSTYTTATANNLLTDDASIMTLASSSKRRRRRSMDTDASVRALAPSSVWGGSRESLPLSVLSGNVDAPAGRETSLAQPRPSIGGMASAERASVYSSHSVAAPALMSDRNSYYAASFKQSIKERERDKDAKSIDGRSVHRDVDDQRSLHGGKSLHESIKGYEGSVRSGALGHMRNDSTSGSTPLTSPGVAPLQTIDASSRRSSYQESEGRKRGGDESEDDTGNGKK